MAKGKSWFTMHAAANGTADISILSEIGGWGITAQMFNEQLDALGSPSELRIAISSDGGDVADGFAIFNKLNRHPANKIVTIEGLAASMASVIAMAGDEVVMPSNAMLMIHNPWGAAIGEAHQLASFAEALGIMQTNIAQTYKARTGLPLSEIKAMMNKETWLSAKDAVAKGFADRLEKVAAPVDAKAFNLTRFNRVPATFGRTSKESTMSATEQKPGTTKAAETVEPTAEQIRTEDRTYQANVRAVCKLAGKADAADAYIAANKPLAEVVVDLETKRETDAKGAKEKGLGQEVSARNNPRDEGRPLATIDTAAIYKRWNKKRAA